MIRTMIVRCQFVGVAVGLLLAIGLVACGETESAKAPPVVSVSTPVAKATVPSGRTVAPAAAAPTARTGQKVAAVVQVTVAPTAAPTQVPTAASTASSIAVASAKGGAAGGRELFTANGCIACHGADLSGGIGPKLSGRTPADLTEDRIRTQVRNGGNGMPEFAKITDQQLADIIMFIRSV
jgi:cytochrome c551